MTESIHDRVTELVNRTESALEEIRSAESEPGDAVEETDLFETASAASEIFESESAEDVLEAFGLDELPDGSEPGSIPEAIARGNPEEVEDLRAFAKLAKLSGVQGEGLEESIENLRGAFAERDTDFGGDSADTSSDGEGDEGESGGDSDADDEGIGDSMTDAVGDVMEEVTDSDGDTDLGDQLETVVRSSFDGFDEEIRDVRDRLEERVGGDGETDAADADDEAADEPADEEAPADAEAADADEADEAEADESFLGDVGSGDSETKRGTMYSTMPPRPSERADMRRSTGYSTMPDRN